jgi:hypothetical protein
MKCAGRYASPRPEDTNVSVLHLRVQTVRNQSDARYPLYRLVMRETECSRAMLSHQLCPGGRPGSTRQAGRLILAWSWYVIWPLS